MTLKLIFASLVLSLGSVGYCEARYRWEVVRVVDGDTIIVVAPWLPPDLGTTIPVRIRGIDTPESGHRGQCARESTLANQATQAVERIISPGDMITVRNISRDKFFRVVGDVEARGNDVGEMLIARGLARRYDGGTKRSWCR
jgi:micrococcal nuclease